MSTQASNPTLAVEARFKNQEAERQWRKVRTHAHTRAGEMVRLGKTLDDWTYHPPASDDPETWTGLLRWCFVEREYTWLLDRAAALKTGSGPFWCRGHQRKPRGEGWQERPCLACSWDTYLYDETLAMARYIGRQRRRAA